MNGYLVAEGNTRNRVYRLHPEIVTSENFRLLGLEEDVVWREFVLPRLGPLPDNVMDIWSYGFTEMLNNAIDHSQGRYVLVSMEKNPAFTQISVTDDGEGIFLRIQRLMGLHNERHAILELAKGKLTTDPENHTGEGIFFPRECLMNTRFYRVASTFHMSSANRKTGSWNENPLEAEQRFLCS